MDDKLLDETYQQTFEGVVKNDLTIRRLERVHTQSKLRCLAANNNLTRPVETSLVLKMLCKCFPLISILIVFFTISHMKTSCVNKWNFLRFLVLVLVVWTSSRGRKVGVPWGILPHVQGGLNPLQPDSWSSSLPGIREGSYGQFNPNTT